MDQAAMHVLSLVLAIERLKFIKLGMWRDDVEKLLGEILDQIFWSLDDQAVEESHPEPEKEPEPEPMRYIFRLKCSHCEEVSDIEYGVDSFACKSCGGVLAIPWDTIKGIVLKEMQDE